MKNPFYLLPILVLLFTACPDDDQAIPDEGPTQGLTAYYPLDGSAVDSISGNNGRVFGAEATEGHLGVTGRALRFDGMNDYVAIPNSVANNFADDDEFALSIWVKFGEQASLARSTNMIIEKLDEDGDIADAYPYSIRIWNRDGQLPGTVFGRRLARNEARTCNERSNVWVDDNAINDEVFHHLVFQRSNGNLELYIDARISATEVDSSTFVSCNTLNRAPLHLGARYAGSNDFYHFKGAMDDFRIYNRSLSASEITWLFDH